MIQTISNLRDANGDPVDPIINLKSRIWKMINDQETSLHVSQNLTKARLGKSRFSNKVLKKLFKLSMEGWVGLRNRNNELIVMRICCKGCKIIWDQEEKECLFCNKITIINGTKNTGRQIQIKMSFD